MIKKKLFVLAMLLLLRSLAYGRIPSAALSVQGAPPASVGVACGIGPNYTGPIPAHAQMAGLTTCGAIYDFANSTYSNLTSWLDCSPYGTAAGGQYQWHIGIAGYPSWGGCNQFSMVTDASINKQVLQIEYPLGTTSIESMATQGNLGTGPIELRFPYTYYVETPSKRKPPCDLSRTTPPRPTSLI